MRTLSAILSENDKLKVDYFAEMAVEQYSAAQYPTEYSSRILVGPKYLF